MCLATLLCEQFCRFANESAKISIKSYFMRSFFFSMYSAAVKCWPNLHPFHFGVNRRLQLSGLGKNREARNCEARCEPQTHHSQSSWPVEVLNLIIESKSQPVELDNSTMSYMCRRGERKACNHFDFLALMRFDMTFDVTLRDDSSFGKLSSNSCN